jgi:hypothetical protein
MTADGRRAPSRVGTERGVWCEQACSGGGRAQLPGMNRGPGPTDCRMTDLVDSMSMEDL